MLKNLKNSERGATVVEYALLLSLFTLILIPSLGASGNGANRAFSRASLAFRPNHSILPGGGGEPWHGGGQNSTGSLGTSTTEVGGIHTAPAPP